MSTKKVYVGFCADLIHHEHINIIKQAKELGEVTVGLLTDKAISTYKQVPLIPFEQRKIIVENIKGVSKIIPQETLDYVPNLRKLKPNYVVHGSDWKTGIQKSTRERVVKVLKEWGGKVIDVPYVEGISSTNLRNNERMKGITNEIRMKRLRRLLEFKPIVRVLEAHNGLTASLIENLEVDKKEFDCAWISSLTDSLAKGKPDTGIVDLTSRINTINQVLESTTKPILLDIDDGGEIEHFASAVRTLERLGVSAIVVEDKRGLKENSLFNESTQNQEDITKFSEKISKGKRAQLGTDFMIIARIESLNLGKGIYDALIRAQAYIEAGADGILIHSKEKEPKELLKFCKEYSKFKNKLPLVVVPTTYSQITEKELIKNGINMVIYANHLLRSAFASMKKTAESILKNERALEADKFCLPVKETLELVR